MKTIQVALALAFVLVIASRASLGSSNAAGDQEHGHFLKGYEIYSWQDPADHWHYALLAGTNRLKSPTEILAAAISETELRSRLEKLPELEDVSWCHRTASKMQPALELPPKTIVDSLLALAHRRNIHLSLCEPQPNTP